MQSQVFGETSRNSSEFQSMLFPRLLTLAERSWHMAKWELSQSNITTALDKDWADFANVVGHKELRRLDNIGVAYRVPPPGAK